MLDAEELLDPYPHYCLDNIFPDEYYQTLLENLPSSTSYENLYEVTTLKLDHFRHRDQRDMNDGWTDSFPIEQKELWNEFDSWFLGDELALTVAAPFDLDDEAGEQVGDGVLLAAAQEPALRADARVVGYENLRVYAARVAHDEGVRVAADYDAFELDLRPDGD